MRESPSLGPMRRPKSRDPLAAEDVPGAPPPLAQQLADAKAQSAALASELAACKTRLQARPQRPAQLLALTRGRRWRSRLRASRLGFSTNTGRGRWVCSRTRGFDGFSGKKLPRELLGSSPDAPASLVGNTLLTYKSEHDAAHLPRASTTLDSTTVVEARRRTRGRALCCSSAHARPQLEGWKRRRYWTWALRDASGGLLLRLSCASASEGEAWVAALRAAGAKVAPLPSDGLFGAEPPLPFSLVALAGGSEPEVSSHGPAPAPPTPPRPGRGGGDGAPRRPAFAGLQGSTPVHSEPRHSPLSSERLLYASHAGLFNLALIVLVVNHCRLILDNLGSYGVRVRAGF